MNQPFQKKVKEVTGDYTLTLADLSYAIRINSAMPSTTTLPTASGFPNFHVDLINVGSGAVTCNGLTLLQGNGLQLYCNGLAWTNMKLLNEVKVADVPIMTSAELATKISDETGTGSVVFSATPTLSFPQIDAIQFDTTYLPASHEEGMVHWNDDEKCLEFGEPNGGSLQIGQEQRLRAKNDEVDTINNGEVVYICGAVGNNICVKRADADSYGEAVRTIAVATENVGSGQNGRFTTFGFVRTLDTSAWEEGTLLYLSSTPGSMSATPPAYPANRVAIGVVTRSHATEGELGVKITYVPRKFGDIDGGDYTGFEDDGTMVFNGDATVYDDMLNQLIGQRLESPSSNIVQNNAEGSLTFQTDATTSDYVTMSVQLSHRWKSGSMIYPHLHWWQAQNNVPNWLLQYRWQRQGQSKTTTWTSVKMNENAFTYVSSTLNQISGFPAISAPSGYSLSDIVQCRIIRDTTNASGLFTGTDPYTVDVDAVNFDIHIECDTAGSRTEYAK